MLTLLVLYFIILINKNLKKNGVTKSKLFLGIGIISNTNSTNTYYML